MENFPNHIINSSTRLPLDQYVKDPLQMYRKKIENKTPWVFTVSFPLKNVIIFVSELFEKI